MSQGELLGPDDNLAELADTAVDVPRDKWPKLLAEMLDVVEVGFCRDGMAPEEAARLARRAMLLLARYHGGHSFYLPAGGEIERALRDDAIFRDLGRIPADILARDHKMSEVRIYQIYREQKALRMKALQPTLF